MSAKAHARYIANFIPAILLIYLTKWIFQQYVISCLMLTLINCFFSGIFSTILLKCLSISNKRTFSTTNYRRLIIISIFFTLFVLFSNRSLEFNTLITYQLIKIQIPPTLMLIQWIQFQFQWSLTREKFLENYSFAVLAAFAIICISTLITTYADLYFHFNGYLYACTSVFSNVFYQTLIETEPSTTFYERTRLVQIQSFISTGILICLWPFVESMNDFYNWDLFFDWDLIISLFLGSILAFLVNLSIVSCIQNDAAIGYNLVGQMKTFVIIYFGSHLFDETLTDRQKLSAILPTIACLIYIYLRRYS